MKHKATITLILMVLVSEHVQSQSFAEGFAQGAQIGTAMAAQNQAFIGQYQTIIAQRRQQESDERNQRLNARAQYGTKSLQRLLDCANLADLRFRMIKEAM